MRRYLKEGDIISAEIQNVNVDGSLSLHTRSMKYGKVMEVQLLSKVTRKFTDCILQLMQGVSIKVNPSLIMKRKSYFHNFPCGTSIVLGTNGLIWISATSSPEDAGKNF